MSRYFQFSGRLRRSWYLTPVLGLTIFMTALATESEPGPGMVTKMESFDRDPGWEGVNNRIVPHKVRMVTQDFGYSPTAFAGREKGEIGGQVWRSTTPAYYAQKIPAKTLNDSLSMSGTFALTACSSSSGLFFGWFSAQQPGSGRPTNSLGWYLDGERSGARLYFAAVTGTNRTHGRFVTPFEPRKGIKPTPIKADGTQHTFALSYDPAAERGNGCLRFMFDGGEPLLTNLPAGFKQEGATFNRFGMMNTHKAGHPLRVYVNGPRHEGTMIDFAEDPRWEGVGNRVTFQDRELTGAHNFGFSPTARAGGKPGEIGGLLWRIEEPPAYYADRVGPLTLDQPLTAHGKVAFLAGAPDSGMYLGWFSASEAKSDRRMRNFVGIYLEGPSRIGHYFRPVYATAKGSRGDARRGPVLVPNGKSHTWKLAYNPAANGGKGTLSVTLANECVVLNLDGRHRAEGTYLDRFGMLTSRVGGGQLKVYFDDLQYTTGGKTR